MFCGRKTMRVGFYVGDITPKEVGGGSVFQTNILNAIKNVDTKHEIYIFYKCKQDIFEDYKNINFVNLKAKKDFKYRIKKILGIHTTKLLNDFAKKYEIDLMYFFCVNYEKVDIPYFYTIWDLAHRENPFFPEVSTDNMAFENREKYYKQILPRASRIIIGNDEGKKQIIKYYSINEKLVETIPMMTPADVYTLSGDNSIIEKLNLTQQKYIYYPAQFWSHKNHIRLLKELKKLKEQYFNIKLVFSGSDQGNMKYIKRKTKELGLDDDVIFAGFLKREEVIALYENAFALTYASYFGPDNIPPLEAMALDCPVICSEFAGAHEQLQDCALFFNPMTGENFIESIKQLQDNNFRELIINKAKILAKQYNTENYVTKMFEVIDEFASIRECWGNIYNE